jgi:hypothetical protein
MKPRKPTIKEKQELIGLYVSKFDMEQDGLTIDVDKAAIAVFDHYRTGMPGYEGKIMMVVWDHGPTIFDVYTWKHGRITLQDRG